jgi:hypothetical protein
MIAAGSFIIRNAWGGVKQFGSICGNAALSTQRKQVVERHLLALRAQNKALCFPRSCIYFQWIYLYPWQQVLSQSNPYFVRSIS